MEVRRNGKMCAFKDIYISDAFYFDRKYYIRIIGLNDFNAVDIESGSLTKFHDGTEVISCEGYYYVK